MLQKEYVLWKRLEKNDVRIVDGTTILVRTAELQLKQRQNFEMLNAGEVEVEEEVKITVVIGIEGEVMIENMTVVVLRV